MKKRKLLLIDDDRGVRESVGHALQSLDYAVTFASSEAQALNFLRDTEFDLAFVDLEMPLANRNLQGTALLNH